MARSKTKLGQAKLSRAYGQLLNSTSRVVGQAKCFAQDIASGVKCAATLVQQLALDGLRQEIDRMVPLVRQVMKQSRARIFHGDTRSEGKIVSVFEPSTEIIRKGKTSKPTEFGKMVKLQEAENQIVTAYELDDQRPADSDLLIDAIDIHQQRLGRAPHLVAGGRRILLGGERAGCQGAGVSSGCAFPTVRPRALRNGANRKSAGSERVRNGAPAARAASASPNAGTASTAAVTGAMTE